MIGEKIDMKKRIVTYPAIFKPIAKDVYFISFPDVKGAITEGHGLADAFDMASDALATVLFDEKEFPKMTDPSKIKVNDEGTFVALVSADLSKAASNFEKTIRKNVTVPLNLATEAEKHHLNFSKVLTEALRKKLSYQN